MENDRKLQTLKIRYSSPEGGIINADLPLGILKPGFELGLLDTLLKEHEALGNIDFDRIMELVDQGYTGEVMNEKTEEGGDLSIVIE
ncbi:MAG: hypothetical protein IKS51_03745 [Erysipelotrichaceae bacterium]|nr:hypothetical protein [Erysipelotrichaceae bacterium]